MERTNKKPKPKSKKGKSEEKSPDPKTKTTPDTPQEGIPDVDFKRFLGCG
ncbi:hypothetical protein [Reichenbachiella sp.]